MTGAPPSPLTSVVIPVREDPVRLARCLTAILANDDARRCEIVVADNGSRDNTPEVARDGGARVLVLPGLSVAQLRNAAARQARGRQLAFIDADHVVGPGWLSAATDTLRSTGAAAVGAPYLPQADGTWVQRAYDRFRTHQEGVHEVEWLGSGNLCVRKDAFDAIGGFDESLETCEDVDLCNRLRQGGHRLVSDSRLESVHLGDPATLRDLFMSELWRGRDNIRVTLRGPVTPRALPSLLLPIANLVWLTIGTIALAAMPWLGVWPFLLCACGIAATIALRTVRMSWSGDARDGQDVWASAAVATVYELARALSLVLKATHQTRRRGRPA
jgi:GT2 family glycosyltransferase